MSCMYWLHLSQISSQSARKWLSYRPKPLKISICKIFKFVFWQKYAIQKDENSTIELPVKFCIETMVFVAKITAVKFSPFFTEISQIHVFNLKLTLTSNHSTYLQKLSTHLNLLVTSFRLLPSVYVYGPSFFELAGEYLPPSPQRRVFGWRPQRRAG